jgi:hypothetical protein
MAKEKRHRVDPKKIEKNFNSVIIEKVIFKYYPKSDQGKLCVHFTSGLVYEYDKINPRYANAFMEADNRTVGTYFNKYINSHFQITKTIRTERFTKMLLESKERDRKRKLTKKEKVNA